MDTRLLTRIEEKKKRLDALRPLSKSVLKKLHENMVIEWTYNSNAIEGNTLTLRETALVLREGITINGKSLREHFEVKNHEKAIGLLEGVVKKKSRISEKIILDLHAMVLDGIEEEFVGRYRTGQVRIMGASFIPPNAMKVPDMMSKLVRTIKSNPEKLHLLELVARSHHRFVWIHPFIDGNGRTGRLLMNLMLMRKGYPPAVILKNDRKKYYSALDRANMGDYEKIELLIGQAIERSLDLYLDAVEKSSHESEYIPLRILSEECGISQEYLSLLARQGKIDAFKEERNWVSSRKSVEDYLGSLEADCGGGNCV